MSAKKYKLFSASAEGGGKRPCAFFGTAEGCRKGDDCPFLHGAAADSPSSGGTPPHAAAVAPNKNSVVTSEEESEGEIEEERPPTTMKREVIAKEENSKKKKNKRKRDAASNMDVFARPKGQDKDNNKSFKFTDLLSDDAGLVIKNEKHTVAASGVDASTAAKQTAVPSSSPPKQKKAKKNNNKASANSSSGGGGFRDLDLPISNFMLPTTGDDKKKKVKESIKQEEPEEEAPKATAAPKSNKNKFTLPKSTEVGRKWKDVVMKTQENPDFSSIFDFTKYKEQEIPGDVWVKSKPFSASKFGANPQAIAIDCEMCETTDPLSGKKDHSALCRISIVDAENPDDVLLNTLVKPSWPVSDYRTFVNGITKEHLESVQFTLRHAQAFLMALCSEETVILGHAVHNDLAAMRFEHYCVGDSALLYKAKDSPTATVSLKDLAMTVLRKEMPSTHDSVNDAVTALKCLDYYREKDGNVEEIVRTPKVHSGNDKSNRTHHKLFVHRIPKFCNTQHLAKMFVDHTNIVPDDIDDIDFTGTKGKTHISFKTVRHAVLAFDSLEGKAEKEGSGRLQKKVYLRDGDYIKIRKMAFERGHQFPNGMESK